MIFFESGGKSQKLFFRNGVYNFDQPMVDDEISKLDLDTEKHTILVPLNWIVFAFEK